VGIVEFGLRELFVVGKKKGVRLKKMGKSVINWGKITDGIAKPYQVGRMSLGTSSLLKSENHFEGFCLKDVVSPSCAALPSEGGGNGVPKQTVHREERGQGTGECEREDNCSSTFTKASMPTFENSKLLGNVARFQRRR